MVLALSAFGRNDLDRGKAWLLVTAMLGAVFMAAALVGIQFAIEARKLAKLRRLKYASGKLKVCERPTPYLLVESARRGGEPRDAPKPSKDRRQRRARLHAEDGERAAEARERADRDGRPHVDEVQETSKSTESGLE